MKYILSIILLFLLSCKSQETKMNSLSLTSKGGSLQVFDGKMVCQLVDNKSFLTDEMTYYDKDFNVITFSKEKNPYPNYREVYDSLGTYIGNIELVKDGSLYVISIHDFNSSIMYKTEPFTNFSKPIKIFKCRLIGDEIVAKINGHSDKKWTIVFYGDQPKIEIMIHILKFMRNDVLVYQ